MEELKDGLRYCRIQKAELRNQAKGLRKVHLQDCLIDAETKKQRDCVRDIKQTINREESKRMWSHSPSVLKVQRVIDGETKDYSIQEDIENAIQRECEIRFSLAHSAPIMSTLLGDRLRYLGDDCDVAKTMKDCDEKSVTKAMCDENKFHLSVVDETLWQAAERTLTPMWEIATTGNDGTQAASPARNVTPSCKKGPGTAG